MLTFFKIPLIVNAIALVIAGVVWGIPAALTILILTVLEVSFSFDNAVVNAKVLKRMDEKWQKLFLTVGIVIAVFGMRLVFPLIVVALAAHINPIAALQLALHNPSDYAHHLHQAHGAIAAFGGVFLLSLFLDWLLEKKDVYWLPVEKHLADAVSPLAVIVVVLLLLPHATSLAGLLGAVTYFAVSKLDNVLSSDKVASAGLGAFLYLEVLDASFSFDGVIGAFAVTSDIFLIMVGLGIGAAYVRSLTVYLTRKGTLAEYRYLEHGAHWAVGALAILLLTSIGHEIPDVVTGLIGVVIIATAFIHSVHKNKTERLTLGIESLPLEKEL